MLITVLDTNDNRPLFQRSSYTIPVGEDTGGGLLIERIQATDKDTGENAQLTYSIVSGNGKGTLARLFYQHSSGLASTSKNSN